VTQLKQQKLFLCYIEPLEIATWICSDTLLILCDTDCVIGTHWRHAVIDAFLYEDSTLHCLPWPPENDNCIAVEPDRGVVVNTEISLQRNICRNGNDANMKSHVVSLDVFPP